MVARCNWLLQVTLTSKMWEYRVPDPPRILPGLPRILPDPPRILNDPPRILNDPPRILNDPPRKPKMVHATIKSSKNWSREDCVTVMITPRRVFRIAICRKVHLRKFFLQ